MSQTVIEGTWEEIKLREAELIGHYLRVTVNPDPPAKTADEPKVLRGYGMFAGLLSTEDFLRERREDTIREDRLL
ncbi:MAG: hypothetical protein ACLQVD_20660 [Capsulimonadaceae bacterium]